MIDTNILISAILFPNSRAADALIKAMSVPYQPVVCDYILNELCCKFQEKFPEHLNELEQFIYAIVRSFEIVGIPDKPIAEEYTIRDPKDRPILRAAINEGVDLFLTGDKDFLESPIKDPKIIDIKTFMEM